MGFGKTLPQNVQDAIQTLINAGFMALTEVRFDDVRDLMTGDRMRTFKHARRRYELVLAMKDVSDIAGIAPAPVEDPETLTRMEIKKLVTTEPSKDSGKPSRPKTKTVRQKVELKPVKEMNVAELRAEARKYPWITGEYKMLKPDLMEEIAKARIRAAENGKGEKDDTKE